MRHFRLIAPLLLIGILLFTACEEEADVPDQATEENDIAFRTDGTLQLMREADTLLTLDIEIADTEEARERGLMDRSGLPELSGMLFVFPNERQRTFWMADTPLSLDLLFADADGEIVSITKYARPYSSQGIESGDPAQYVLEVPAGFTDRYGIIEGDRLQWDRH